MELEFKEHRQSPPDKSAKARTIADYTEKEHYLEHEVKFNLKFRFFSIRHMGEHQPEHCLIYIHYVLYPITSCFFIPPLEESRGVYRDPHVRSSVTLLVSG